MAENAEVVINQGAVLKIKTGQPTAFDQTTWQTYMTDATEVGQVHNMGDYGGTRDIQTHDTISDGKRKKRGGVKDAGDLSVEFGKAISDAGQAAVIAAFESGETVSVSIVDDLVEEYFVGIISDITKSRGDANTIITQSGTVALSEYFEFAV